VGEWTNLRPRERQHLHLPPCARRQRSGSAARLHRHPVARPHHDLDPRRYGEPTLRRGASMKTRHYIPLAAFVVPSLLTRSSLFLVAVALGSTNVPSPSRRPSSGHV